MREIEDRDGNEERENCLVLSLLSRSPSLLAKANFPYAAKRTFPAIFRVVLPFSTRNVGKSLMTADIA